MIIQGNDRTKWCYPGILLKVVIAVLFLMAATACSRTVQTREPVDFSHISPDELLRTFLENEGSSSPVKFTFTGEFAVEAGESHSFRGVAVFKTCSALRIKLLGPLGYTLLEYVNLAGKASLLANQLTPEGDAQALEGLLTLMDVLTLALTDRCQPHNAYRAGKHDANHVMFTVPTRNNTSLQFTLARKTAFVTSQSITGGGFQEVLISYTDYNQDNDNGSPGKIEIEGREIPVSVIFVIKKWEVTTELPPGFFTDR